MMRLTEDTYDPTYAEQEMEAIQNLVPIIQDEVTRIAAATNDPEECKQCVYAILSEMMGLEADMEVILIAKHRQPQQTK